MWTCPEESLRGREGVNVYAFGVRAFGFAIMLRPIEEQEKFSSYNFMKYDRECVQNRWKSTLTVLVITVWVSSCNIWRGEQK